MRILSLIFLLIATPSLYGQYTNAVPLVKVRIVPVSGAWDYKLNEPIEVEISVERSETSVNNINILIESGPEQMPYTQKKEVMIKNGKTIYNAGRFQTPGFYTVQVTANVDGVKYSQWKTFGVAPEQVQPTVKMPADFRAFWTRMIEETAKIPLEPQLTLLPEQCTPKCNVYEISYNYTQWGGRFYGILCVPHGEKKFPAIISVPGAGVWKPRVDVATAEKGYITLDIGIHGISATLPESVFTSLHTGALANYLQFNMDNRENYYYKRVYMGCKRAVDFIFSLPQFDGQHVAITGGSQGGALSLAVSALDQRVTCTVCVHPALSDMTGSLHGRAIGWPFILKNPATSVHNKKEFIETLSYYDAVNFARILKVPVFYSTGYNDKVCPPTTTFSVFNATTAPKELFMVYETAHWRFPEQGERIQAFFDKHLKQ